MQIESQIINIINDKLKSTIYQTIQLLNIKTILTKSNFSKKEGAEVHMVVLHFVYMLVMNKKMSTFMDQRNDSLKICLLQKTSYLSNSDANIYYTKKNS